MSRPTTAAFVALAALLPALAGCSFVSGIQEGVQEGLQSAVPSIAIGECTDLETPSSEGGDTVNEIVKVDCSQAHLWEAYAEETMDDESYPGEQVAADRADTFCYDQFETYVGISYDESVYELVTLYPVEGSWTLLGDRTITCLVGDPQGGVVGSLKDANA